MGLLDPSLNFLLQRMSTEPLHSITEVDSLKHNLQPSVPEVRVVIHFKGSLEHAEAAGFRPTSVASRVAAGFASIANLERIAAAAGVTLVESSRPMLEELDRSIKEVRADCLHAAAPPCKGAGVIVGIIESGIDYTHKCFLDECGRTRILALWDQMLTPQGEESSPKNFAYGVEYTKEVIDEALKLGEHASQKVRHAATNSHGTLVAGVAVGNGSVPGKAMDGNEVAAETLPAGTYVGVAPEADMMVVAYNNEGSMGESCYLIDAINYLLDKAGQRPIVINISQGDYLGSHDGTSGLELYIDDVMGRPGQIIVKSAGNASGNSTHASGTIHTGQRIALNLKVKQNDDERDVIDIWYPGSDRLEIAIKSPLHPPSNGISPGDSRVTLTLPNKNQVYIESISRHPVNGDNRIYVCLQPGKMKCIEEGEWELILTGREVYDGRFHAWIERAKKGGETIPEFFGPYANDSCTISIPGTASKIITVGSYITHIHVNNPNPNDQAAIDSLMGTLDPGSSFGPTRDGRSKPEIVAPGHAIISARRGKNDEEQYFMKIGTSMSAPHVTGAIALLLEQNPKLTQAEVKEILCKHARTDIHTNSTPQGWGAGKLDVLACHESLTQPKQ